MKTEHCRCSRPDRRTGSAVVEFVLIASFVLVPLILGLLSVGFTLTRSLQVAQLTRDVGRMFVRGVDFSLQSSQNLITGSSSTPNLPALAGGLGMQGNGGNATGGTTGNGVLVLSIMDRVATNCSCNNAGHIVLTRRIVVGNKTLFTSGFGNPSSIDSATGEVDNYTNDVAARADSFSSVVNIGDTELAFMVEAQFNFSDLAIPGFISNPGVFWRSVF